nr:class I SAM-dependent methyltransferase [Microbacterium pseudoresistens]
MLGDIDAMSPRDRALIADWAARIDGRILDAGCGPGHWTAYLRGLGADIEGVDLVPEFIASARARFPDTAFQRGALETLPVDTGALAGLLSWYSLIHVEPARMPTTLHEFARCLAPGGSLLLGFFEGPRTEPFDHAVTTAYFWPVDAMRRLLRNEGFEIVDVVTRSDPGSRPHAAIEAVSNG